MTKESRNFNKKIDEQNRIDGFSLQAKLVIAGSILIGLLITLTIFIGTVRATDKIVQLLNN